MTDDVDMRVADRPDHRLRILLDRSRFVAKRVDARYPDIQHREVFLAQIDRTLIIDDVQFRPEQ